MRAELAPLGIHVTVVEPGYFCTDFLDASSLSDGASRIAAYDATAARARCLAADVSHRQPGNPARLAATPAAFAEAPVPPVRLPLGSDMAATIEAKHVVDRGILAAQRSVSLSTDFDPGDVATWQRGSSRVEAIATVLGPR